MKTTRRIRPFLIVLFLLLLSQPVLGFQYGAVPTPESIIGFKPGTDYKLANWEQISAYFQALDRASDRIALFDVGQTEMGNSMLLAIISSEENLSNLDNLKEIQKKLADPRKTSDSELPILLRDGKTVVLMTCSLHGTEVGASQMAPILAYELVTGTSDVIRDIRENVVFVMFPSANPDGVMLIADHYMSQNPGPGVEIKPLPRVYNKYTGHDNNRDFYMLTQKESRLIAHQLYKEWLPEIVMDMHQMGNGGARFFLPPFDDPLNPVIHPQVVRGLQIIGGYFNSDLIDGGYPWVENQNRFSMWWHGGMRTAPYFHNMVGILSEAASANLASPIPPRGFEEILPTINYPVPWQHDRSWGIGDIVEQDRISAIALLKCAARNRDMFLKNFYTMNKEAVEKRRAGAPFAYVMPATQHDPGAARYFREIMIRQKTEFYTAEADFTAGGKRFEKGSIIAYLNQPSQAHVEAIFGLQKYPDSARTPYDITGWTLPLQMGVQYERIENQFSVRTTPYTEAAFETLGENDSRIKTYVIKPNSVDHYMVVNRLLAKGHKVEMLSEPVTVGSRMFEAGSKVIKHSRNVERDLREILKDVTVEMYGVSESVKGDKVRIKKPRIAMVDDPSSMPVGWMRWLMDTNEFPFTMINEEDFQSGDLHKKFDVILFTTTIPRMRRGQRTINVPGSVKESLKTFLEKEGTVVAWGTNADYVSKALDLGLTNAAPAARDKFSIPGSILEVRLNTDDPLTVGMQDVTHVFFGSGTTQWKSGVGEVLGRYPNKNPLVSGYAHGSEYIQNTPNVMRTTVGKGEVVLIGFNPVFRAQPVGSFKLVFNAIFNSAH